MSAKLSPVDVVATLLRRIATGLVDGDIISFEISRSPSGVARVVVVLNAGSSLSEDDYELPGIPISEEGEDSFVDDQDS